MRIGWSDVRMTALMPKGGAPRNRRRPSAYRLLLPVHLLLEEHVAADGAVFSALSATSFPLARGLRHVGVHFLLASDILGRCGHVVEGLDQIEIRLACALVGVGEDV